jgi:hypothetical protein
MSHGFARGGTGAGINIANTAPGGAYVAHISMTAVGAAAVSLWSMRNPVGSTRVVFIRKIHVHTMGGATAAKEFTWARFSAATPTGGAAITAVRRRNTFPATVVTDIRQAAAGLTTTGVTFESIWASFWSPIAVDTPSPAFCYDFGVGSLDLYSPFSLAAGEGLILRKVTASGGDDLGGYVEWDERA